jgi:hypothetical protein
MVVRNTTTIARQLKQSHFSNIFTVTLLDDPAFNKFENPRVALNNKLVASDDFLTLP